MKTIIAGSRSITDQALVDRAILKSGFIITEVFCGTASGVDQCGLEWANEHRIPVRWYPADWEEEGRKAGLLRNERMAKQAEAAVVIWDGVSRGARDMIQRAKRHGLKLYVHYL